MRRSRGRAGHLAGHLSFTLALALTAALTGALALGARPAAAGEPDVIIRVLTYNVAGLPLGLSSSHPEVNSLLISPRLNEFDLVVVQEDFGFHDDLTSAIDHPYVTEKDTRDTPFVIQLAMNAGIDPPGLGDGLNTFSRSPFLNFTRVTWDDCFGELDNGSDCLAFKGFSFARHEIAPGLFVDVYDLHADAGEDDGSLAARRANLRQLADYIVANSAGRALIVLGDTNSRYTRQEDILREFVATIGVTDVWVELVRGGDVPPFGPSLRDCQDFASPDCERVDKIFYRSGDEVEITALSHAVPSDWVDSLGEQLSDHEPLVAELGVTFVPEPSAAALAAAALGALAALARQRSAARRDAVERDGHERRRVLRLRRHLHSRHGGGEPRLPQRRHPRR